MNIEIIQEKAHQFRDRQVHHSDCNTQQPYHSPTNSRGETMDVYLIPHCNCWLSSKDDSPAFNLLALRGLSRTYTEAHERFCDYRFPVPITYRDKPELLWKNCNCYLSVDIPDQPPVNYEKDTKENQEQENPMTTERINSNIAKARAEEAIKATQEAEAFFAPHLAKWLDLEVKEGNLTNHEAGEDFRICEMNDHWVEFESGMSEETWQYGGHELHYGNSLQIPWDFFDDHAPFEKASQDRIDEKLNAAKRRAKESKKQKVNRLRAELARAESEL